MGLEGLLQRPAPSPGRRRDAWTYRFARPRKDVDVHHPRRVALRGTTASLTSQTAARSTWACNTRTRASDRRHLDADEIIDTSPVAASVLRGVAYGIAYPFTVRPDLRAWRVPAGAMEARGCAFATPCSVRPTEDQRWRLAPTTITARAGAHVVPATWCMKWVNDLWLKQVLRWVHEPPGLGRGLLPKAGPASWSRRLGPSGSAAPRRTPITAEIRDLATSRSTSTASYAKGASVLRQLVSYVGRDAFFAGLHEYLTKHSCANATLDDLLTALAASGDLASWSRCGWRKPA